MAESYRDSSGDDMSPQYSYGSSKSPTMTDLGSPMSGSPKSGNSPFGDAAPVQVREVEVKRPEAAERKKPNPFGDAAPVQTREVEIKDRPPREERARDDDRRGGGKGREDREQGRSKVGVWGRSAKEEREKEAKSPKGAAPTNEEKPASKPARESAPAPVKKKDKGPANAFEALMGDDEDDN